MASTAERLRASLGGDLEHLVLDCTHGEEAARRRLLEAVRELAVSLGRHTYRMGLEDAEDMAQVVQIRVLERLPQLRRPGAFPLWVRRLIHHVAIDILRQRRWTLSLDAPEAPEDFSVEPQALDAYDQILLRTDLNRALSRLPDRYRQPIELHLLRGIPQDQVGRRLGRPRSTVATQIERGLKRLRPMMAGAA
jgi:RNA polymerase sigma-70 factor (ECF subfamily)